MTELVKLRLIICGFCLIFAVLSAGAGVFDVSSGSLIAGLFIGSGLVGSTEKKTNNQ